MTRELERDRQKRITEALEMAGFIWVHFRPAMKANGRWVTNMDGHKGFPDIVAVHPVRGLVLFVEVKADKGKLTVEQRQWLTALKETPCFDPEYAHPEVDGGVFVCDSPDSEADLLSLILGQKVTVG